MSGIFAMWQAAYAERGIATFPVGNAKKPAVKRWQRIGLKGSTVLATKFQDADAFGYVTGRRSDVTVLDIDTTDERIADDAIQRHGLPVIVIRTASGKRHFLYKYGGERRRIRPFRELPIDILGDNGYAIAPPSKLNNGSYEIIHGHFDDLDRLVPLVGIDIAELLLLHQRRLRFRPGSVTPPYGVTACGRRAVATTLKRLSISPAPLTRAARPH